MWTGHTVRDPRALKITVQFVVLATPIRPNDYDFSAKKTLNMRLKSIKHFLNVRLVLKEIYPTKTRVVIDKAHIILITSRGGNTRPPNIRMD